MNNRMLSTACAGILILIGCSTVDRELINQLEAEKSAALPFVAEIVVVPCPDPRDTPPCYESPMPPDDPAFYVGVVTNTTSGARKETRRSFCRVGYPQRDYIKCKKWWPEEKRMCTASLKRRSSLGTYEWEWYGAADMNHFTVRMLVEGGNGRGRVAVEGYATFAPDHWTDAQVQENCTFEVQEIGDGGELGCDCICAMPDGTIRDRGYMPTSGSCSSYCAASFRGSTGICEAD